MPKRLYDYSCKHPSYDKLPTKTHVLVCAEHKDVEENKTIFGLYKFKCILKQKHIQLPEFSREIKLSFYLDQLTTPQTQQQSSPNATNNSTVQDSNISTANNQNKHQQILHFLWKWMRWLCLKVQCNTFINFKCYPRTSRSNNNRWSRRCNIGVSAWNLQFTSMEVKPQCPEFALIIQHRDVHYTRNKAKC